MDSLSGDREAQHEMRHRVVSQQCADEVLQVARLLAMEEVAGSSPVIRSEGS